MDLSTNPADLRALTREAREIWDRRAANWDEYMGEGNRWHLKLVSSSVERLLELQPDELILDIACGNGMLARRLARLGARVVACDFSPAFIERARIRSADFQDRIEYSVVDATDLEALLELGERSFDGATCTQGLMDMPVIAPVFEATMRLVKPGGRFVITVPHPCFNTHGMSFIAERSEDDTGFHTTSALKLTRYLTPSTVKGAGIPNEPEPHYYFDRSLSAILGAGFEAGLVLDGILEPSFRPAGPDAKLLAWDSLHDFPPVLAPRFRVPT